MGHTNLGVVAAPDCRVSARVSSEVLIRSRGHGRGTSGPSHDRATSSIRDMGSVVPEVVARASTVVEPREQSRMISWGGAGLLGLLFASFVFWLPLTFFWAGASPSNQFEES